MDAKILNKILANWIQQHIEDHTAHQVGFILHSQGWFNICKSINIIHHINKSQNPHDHLNRCRKSIWQNPASIHDKNSNQSRQRENIIKHYYLNIIKAVYDKPTANIIFNRGKLKTFLLKFGTRQLCPFSLLLFNIVLEVLATAIRQTKEMKGIQIGMKEVKLSLCRWHNTIYRKS